MKRRIITAVIAALVYAATYATILSMQGEEIILLELAFGTVLFFVAFYLLRTWIERRRGESGSAAPEQQFTKQTQSEHEKEDQKDISA